MREASKDDAVARSGPVVVDDTYLAKGAGVPFGALGGAIVDPNALSSEGSPFQQVRTFFHMLQPEELERSVDVICSSHTLEHVVDVHRFFKTAKNFKEQATLNVRE